MPFRVSLITLPIYGVKPPKTYFGGAKRHFKPNVQNTKTLLLSVGWLKFNALLLWKLQQQQQQPFYSPLSGTTQVSRYQKKHSPTHHPDHPPSSNYVLGNLFAQPLSIIIIETTASITTKFCTMKKTSKLLVDHSQVRQMNPRCHRVCKKNR